MTLGKPQVDPGLTLGKPQDDLRLTLHSGGSSFLVRPMWELIRLWSSRASVTMVTSTILEKELRGVPVPPRLPDTAPPRHVVSRTRPGRTPGASLYTRKRLSPATSCNEL